ncbi:MAG TPA: hypothetical protein VGK16_11675 [Candidatus Limnocylindrales bacterium]|jgi:hypothetical protein
MTRQRVPWVVAVLDIAVFLFLSIRPIDGGVAAVLLYAAGIASFTLVGALLMTRVPTNPIGALLLAAGTSLVASITIGMYADVGATQVPPWPGAAFARLIGDVSFIYPFVIALVGVPLVFPDGRLPSPRYRWVVLITVALMVVWTILGTVFSDLVIATLPALAVLRPVVGVAETFVLGATLVTFGAAALANLVRFRRGGIVERQQIKWLAADVGVAALVVPLALILTDPAPDVANALSSVAILALFTLPVVIAIAILRYRLYEIDRIISRTIGWAIVTGVLVAVFAGGVIVLQAVLAPFTNENTLAVAASTLVAFALFQPVRRRVQRAVDRRFDRARYDGQRTVEAFAGRVRGRGDLDGLEADVTATVVRALRPTTMAIWLRPGRP